MSTKHVTTLHELLLSRDRTGQWLAREVETTESTVSKWRRGLIPSEANRKRIYATLEATQEEIAALGWEQEVVGA
jgi:hypothetical protein